MEMSSLCRGQRVSEALCAVTIVTGFFPFIVPYIVPAQRESKDNVQASWSRASKDELSLAKPVEHFRII